MKYWFITQTKNGPSEWEVLSSNLNQTKITTKMDGYDFPMPVNTKTISAKYLDRFGSQMQDWPEGQILRQYERGIADIRIKQHNGNFYLAPGHVPPMFYDNTNSQKIDFSLIEAALEQHDWVSFGMTLIGRVDFDLNILMQQSKYVVRDEKYKLKYLNSEDVIEERDNIRMITFFVAYKLGNTGIYILQANPDFLSINGQLDNADNDRYVHYNTSHNSIVKFAFQPAMNCKMVANTVIVDKDVFMLEVLRDSQISSIQKATGSLLSIGFSVKSSWDAEIQGNLITCKKQPGMGYLQITFDCDDMTKPYITADDRKITLEYLLLGV